MKPKNKKGQLGIILFFVFLFLILIVGFIGAMMTGTIGFVMNEVTPIMQGLGVVGDSNISEVVEYTVVPANNFIQAFKWVFAFCLVVALFMSIGLAGVYRVNPNPVFIGFYFMMVILLILGSIIMSNMYQDIYDGKDEIAQSLQAQPITSYMILYSPHIFTVIAMLTGIYMFTREPEGQGGGGFGV